MQCSCSEYMGKRVHFRLQSKIDVFTEFSQFLVVYYCSPSHFKVALGLLSGARQDSLAWSGMDDEDQPSTENAGRPSPFLPSPTLTESLHTSCRAFIENHTQDGYSVTISAVSPPKSMSQLPRSISRRQFVWTCNFNKAKAC